MINREKYQFLTQKTILLIVFTCLTLTIFSQQKDGSIGQISLGFQSGASFGFIKSPFLSIDNNFRLNYDSQKNPFGSVFQAGHLFLTNNNVNLNYITQSIQFKIYVPRKIQFYIAGGFGHGFLVHSKISESLIDYEYNAIETSLKKYIPYFKGEIGIDFIKNKHRIGFCLDFKLRHMNVYNLYKPNLLSTWNYQYLNLIGIEFSYAYLIKEFKK